MDRARNGAEAVDQLTRAADHTYAAVLMDMQMPVMDGLSATRALRALPRFEGAAHHRHDGQRHHGRHGAHPRLRHERPHCQTAAGGAAVADAVALAGTFGQRITGPSRRRHRTPHQPRNPAPPARAEAAAAQATVFDVALLQDLQGSITTARLLPLIAQFVQDCERRVARITEAAQARQWEALRRQAHDLGARQAASACPPWVS